MSQLWNVASEVQIALGAHYDLARDRISKETGLQSSLWNLLVTALSYEPEPISVTQIQKRNPYTAAAMSEQRLETLKGRDWLGLTADSDFCLTEDGRNQARSILETLRMHYATIEPLPLADLNRVAELLDRIVRAAETAPTPPGAWCIERARRLKLPESAAPMTKIDHHLASLNAFRDDSHLAAWRPHSVDGLEWEAFTLIWRGEVKTLDELSVAIPSRRHSLEAYGTALKQLEEKGWVDESSGAYVATSRGKILREQVEETTELYFSRAEAALNMQETNELLGLLGRMREALKTLSSHVRLRALEPV